MKQHKSSMYHIVRQGSQKTKTLGQIKHQRKDRNGSHGDHILIMKKKYERQIFHVLPLFTNLEQGIMFI